MKRLMMFGLLLLIVMPLHAQSLQYFEVLRIHSENNPYWIAWHPKTEIVATTSAGHFVEIWNATSGEVILTLEDSNLRTIEALAWSPDGTLLATSAGAELGITDRVLIWDWVNGIVVQTLAAGGMQSIAWSPNGQYLLTVNTIGCNNQGIMIWDVANGGYLSSLAFSFGRVPCFYAARWLNDDRLAVTVDVEGQPAVFIVDRATGAVNSGGEGLTIQPQSVSVNPAAPQLGLIMDVPNLRRNDIQIWDYDRNEIITTVSLPEGESGYVSNVVWKPDGSLLAASAANNLYFWDAETFELLSVIKEHEATIRSFTWSPDGFRLASVAGDGTLIIWEITF